MTSTATQTQPAATAEVLAVLRGHKTDRDAAEIAMAKATIEWAVLNEVESDDWYANFGQGFGDRGLPLAGAGAPLVSEFAAMEYAAALGMSTDAGKAYLGRVLELRHRLPRLWARVMAGKVPVWRAGRIADQRHLPPPEGAAHVDRHLAHGRPLVFVGATGPAGRRSAGPVRPRNREAKRREAAERRHVDVDLDQVSFDGTVRIEGEVDLADALDLEDALRLGAKQQADLGSTESLDVRRSIALGDLARRQLAFGFDTEPNGPGRGVDLHVHISEDAIYGTESVGRCGNTRSPVSVDQIRGMVRQPQRRDHHQTGGRPGRAHPPRCLRSIRPAQGTKHPGRRPLRVPATAPDPPNAATADHVVANANGGTTCSCNTAPLADAITGRRPTPPGPTSSLERGTYLWTTPNGIHLIRDHHGTTSLPGEP